MGAGAAALNNVEHFTLGVEYCHALSPAWLGHDLTIQSDLNHQTYDIVEDQLRHQLYISIIDHVSSLIT